MSGIRKVSVTEEELRKLENVGSGAYGTVFADKEEGFVIKRYNDLVRDIYWGFTINPCLNVKSLKYKRLNMRSKIIKYTDTEVELVYDGYEFIGVKKKYYDAVELGSLGNVPLTVKKDFLTQLIRNARELTRNRVYCLDYKTDNIVVTKSGVVKILDLDDIWTKVTLLPNVLYNRRCLQKLKMTILDVIYNNQLCFSETVTKRITSSPENNDYLQQNLNYRELQKFVDTVKFEGSILIIKAEDIKKIDIKELKNYLDDNSLSLVLSFDKRRPHYTEILDEIFDYLEGQDVVVYDIFKYEDDYEEAVDNYITSHECSNPHAYEKSFKILEKK